MDRAGLLLQGRSRGFESLNAHQSRTPIGVTSAQQRCMPGFDRSLRYFSSPRVGDPAPGCSAVRWDYPPTRAPRWFSARWTARKLKGDPPPSGTPVDRRTDGEPSQTSNSRRRSPPQGRLGRGSVLRRDPLPIATATGDRPSESESSAPPSRSPRTEPCPPIGPATTPPRNLEHSPGYEANHV